MYRLSQLIAKLDTVLSNSTVMAAVMDIANDIGSLQSVVDVRTVSSSCKFSLHTPCSAFEKDT